MRPTAAFRLSCLLCLPWLGLAPPAPAAVESGIA